MKRPTLGDDLYVDIYQASEVTCSSSEYSSVDSILTSCGNWGHLLNLSDQFRRKFSLYRPFEGGYEPPLEFPW